MDLHGLIHGYPRIEDRHLFIKKTQDRDTLGLIDPHEYPRIENRDRVCEENSRQTKEIDDSEQRLIYEWQGYLCLVAEGRSVILNMAIPG